MGDEKCPTQHARIDQPRHIKIALLLTSIPRHLPLSVGGRYGNMGCNECDPDELRLSSSDATRPPSRCRASFRVIDRANLCPIQVLDALFFFVPALVCHCRCSLRFSRERLRQTRTHGRGSNDWSASARTLDFIRTIFFPEKVGPAYSMPTLLQPVSAHRQSMTVFSGLDHRGRNGHEGWQAWMSGSATGKVSMDQVVAREIGDRTRHASLQLTCGRPPAQAKISFTKEGVPLPMIGRPSVLYGKLFRSGADLARINYLLESNRSVLDGALEEARAIERTLAVNDRVKLRQYFAAVRDVEGKLRKQQLWQQKPIPSVDYALPQFDPVSPDLALECETIMYDLMSLALTTDSTRVNNVSDSRVEPGFFNRRPHIVRGISRALAPWQRSREDPAVQPGRSRARSPFVCVPRPTCGTS